MRQNPTGLESQKERLKKAAPLFAALGDPIRLTLVTRLCREGPLTTSRLKRDTSVSRQGVTKHLQLLEDAGLVHSQKVGKDRLWRLEHRRLSEARRHLDQIAAQWDATLERLRRFVEGA